MSLAHLVVIAGWCVALLSLYCAVGGFIPFVVALRSIRLEVRTEGVTLRALDARAMLGAGWFVWGAPPLLLPWGNLAMVVAVGVLALFWFSLRLEVAVTPAKTTLVRRCLFVLPWSETTVPGTSQAHVDGWGDVVDPEALHLALGQVGTRIELAWGDASSGDLCDEIATAFNLAVTGMANNKGRTCR